jgi:curved DNA-binding protein CbpA
MWSDPCFVCCERTLIDIVTVRTPPCYRLTYTQNQSFPPFKTSTCWSSINICSSTTMIKTDAYSVLGLTPSATEKEIKDAHRKLVLRYHPDKNGGSEEANTKFVEVQQAFEKLTMQDVDEEEGEAVPFTTERSPSPAPRYRSPPPPQRRSRDQSPPLPRTPRRKPVGEERKPRDRSTEPKRGSYERRRTPDRRSYRPPTPPKDPGYEPRGRYKAYSKTAEPSSPRMSSTIYEVRTPHRRDSPMRDKHGHQKRHAKQFVEFEASAPPQCIKHSYPGTSRVETASGCLVLPTFEKTILKISDADYLAGKIDRKMHEIFEWTMKTTVLDHCDRKDLRRARTEAAELHTKVSALRFSVFRYHSEGWHRHAGRVLNLYDDCVHTIGVLEAANSDLNRIMEGNKYRIDDSFFRHINAFSDRFSRLPGPVQSTVTVSQYQAIAL